jgi:outer membrane protein assembly factor BamD (BamD/ComL family)
MLCLAVCVSLAYAQESGYRYTQALEAVNAHDENTAFMHFRSLLTDFPDSRYAEPALFAIAEYYFYVADYQDSWQDFSRFVNDYPDSRGKLFALAYLLNIAGKQNKEALVKGLEKEIILFRQMTFLFRNSKEFKYTSALRKKYKAVYYIDKIEFYVNNELYAKISY